MMDGRRVCVTGIGGSALYDRSRYEHGQPPKCQRDEYGGTVEEDDGS